MKDIPHWDVDEDYIVDVTEGHILFSAENANKQEIKLASAAPDLLEALKLALNAMNEMGDILNFHDLAEQNKVDELTPAFDKARAAISKALGEE
ncbi:hypothetical protein OHI49_001128 [Salmonella enterica]|nr:hypothetical protein [Salmonella enterica]